MKTPKEELKKKILKMYKKDQDMRTKWMGAGMDMDFYDASIDERNQKEIRKIIDEIGWPKISEYGEEIAGAAWTLVQHTPYNAKGGLEFRKKVISEIEKLPKREIEKPLLAKLIDRTRLQEGKGQLYGTSFNINNKTKKISVDPIDEIESINERREEMGLDSFEKHRKRAFDSYAEYMKKSKNS